ncbi:MAG: exo-beta-N-acetylmuramidase NamZ domain-containing protein, partial [Hoylesella saccharolytica]
MLCPPFQSWARNKQVMTGIDVLEQQAFKCLQGKRVGLITNPTGVNRHLVSTVDVLNNAPGVNLVALYGPEHGVRGDVHAGDKVDNIKDAKTGLPVYSLYGKTRKPTAEMLKDIDVLVYDIQDIGCRSFTFISTMGLAMEAAAENGKEFVVLDRPNPIGGLKVEGNITDNDCISFVSQFKIPYLYGLTCGELAQMLNGERMLNNSVQCKLTVVKMKNWKRKMNYAATGLQWIPSSPHIPQAVTAYYYPTSGILGELGYMSIGVGYTIPFQMFAASWINAIQLADAMNAHHLSGVTFRPIYLKPFYSVGKGEQMQGVEMHITDYQSVQLTPIQFILIEEIARLYPEHSVMEHADTKRFGMFDKVSGSKQIRERLALHNRWTDVKSYWDKDVE